MVVCGDFRCVVLIFRYAIKLPRRKWWRMGRQCNRWERARCGRYGGPGSRNGTACFARSCSQIASAWWSSCAREDFIPLDQRPYPDTTTEVNPGNVGWLDGRVVEIVYGLASEDIISKRRAYYAERARHAWRHRVGRRCV
jgi:hypothetical protein